VNLGVARTRETDVWKTLATADVRSRENRTAARCGSVAAEKIRNTRRARHSRSYENVYLRHWRRITAVQDAKNAWYILIKLLSVVSDVSVMSL